MEASRKNIVKYHPLTRKGNAHKYGEARVPTSFEISRDEAVADWVGTEQADGVIAALRPEPVAIGALVDSLLQGGKAEAIQLVDKIHQLWAQIIGADNASHVTPIAVRDDKLELAFIEAPWRYVLDNPPQRALILKRVLELTGVQLKGIVFVPYIKK